MHHVIPQAPRMEPTEPHRRFARTISAVLLSASLFALSDPATAQQFASVAVAAPNLNAPGTEGAMLAAQVGTWTVTETVWDKPGARPAVINGQIAERRLIGNLLEETLRSASGTTTSRRDFLTFNRVEGRWEYMSFDTRAAVGMMTAQSYGAERKGSIEIFFQPFALPGDGAARGQMLRMRQEIIRFGPDHVVKDQYFTLADGQGGEWLAHRYDSVRSR